MSKPDTYGSNQANRKPEEQKINNQPKPLLAPITSGPGSIPKPALLSSLPNSSIVGKSDVQKLGSIPAVVENNPPLKQSAGAPNNTSKPIVEDDWGFENGNDDDNEEEIADYQPSLNQKMPQIAVKPPTISASQPNQSSNIVKPQGNLPGMVNKPVVTAASPNLVKQQLPAPVNPIKPPAHSPQAFDDYDHGKEGSEEQGSQDF